MAAAVGKADSDITQLNRLRPDTAGHNLIVKAPPPPPSIPAGSFRALRKSVKDWPWDRFRGDTVSMCGRSWKTGRCRHGKAAAAGRVPPRHESLSVSSVMSPESCSSPHGMSRVRPHDFAVLPLSGRPYEPELGPNCFRPEVYIWLICGSQGCGRLPMQ